MNLERRTCVWARWPLDNRHGSDVGITSVHFTVYVPINRYVYFNMLVVEVKSEFESAEAYSFSVKFVFEKNENKQKAPGVSPFKKWIRRTVLCEEVIKMAPL